MRALSCCGAVLAGLLLAVLAGCGQGDTVPLLAPGGASEWPPDQRWTLISPVAGTQQSAAVDQWPDSDRGIIVGTAGLAMVRDEQRWYREDPGLEIDLIDVACGVADEAVAVGRSGLATVRDATGWRRETTGVTADLHRVEAVGGTYWAVGAGGAVARRDADGWHVCPLPDAVDLWCVAAGDDTVFAGGSGGRLWAHALSAWRVLPAGPWADNLVGGLARATDGRLFVYADSIYVRDPDGWRALGREYWNRAADERCRLRLADGCLWIDDQDMVQRLDLTTGEIAPYWSNSEDVALSVDDTGILAVSSRNKIVWLTFDGNWGLAGEHDPEGLLLGTTWAGFAADPAVFYSNLGLFRATPAGMIRLRDAAALRLPDGNTPRALAGTGADDFLALSPYSIHRWRNGTWSEQAAWPQSVAPSPRGFAVDSRGAFVLAINDGVGRWTGDTWEWVLGEAPDADSDIYFGYYSLRRGGGGDLLGWSSWGQLYREENGAWFQVAELDDINFGLQTADGELVGLGELHGAWSSSTALVRVRPGTGRSRIYVGEEIGVLANRRIHGATDLGGEILVWTRSPTQVFRLAGYAGHIDWELVAGTLSDVIGALIPLPDGSLLALSTSSDRIYLHRPR